MNHQSEMLSQNKRLLLISLDAVSGTDADALLMLPAFQKLRLGGVFCRHMQTVYPTLTYPIHTSLVTGCYPDTHGIGHNEPFQPDTAGDMRTWYWTVDKVRVKTLHQAAREKGMRVASILWPVTGMNRAIRYNFPEVLPLPGENATMKMLKYGTAWWLLWTEFLYGKQRKSIKQPDLDDYAALLCEKLLEKNKCDFLSVHLVDCDSMRHAYGADSAQAQAAMVRLNARVERILAALERGGHAEDTLIAVVSDHGQKNVSQCVRIDEKLKELQIPARAQSLGMGAYLYCDRADEAKVMEMLRENKAALRIADIYGNVKLRALHAPLDVHIAVNAQSDVTYADCDEGEMHRGDHGFAVTDAQAQCLMWLCGRNIKKNVEIEKIDTIDIAPTLARALGLALPDAQGRAAEEVFL